MIATRVIKKVKPAKKKPKDAEISTDKLKKQN